MEVPKKAILCLRVCMSPRGLAPALMRSASVGPSTNSSTSASANLRRPQSEAEDPLGVPRLLTSRSLPRGTPDVDLLAAMCGQAPGDSLTLRNKDTKLTKIRLAKALGTLLVLFALVYSPAFLIVALGKLGPPVAVPVIIVMSLAVASLLIYAVSRRTGSFSPFGFRLCPSRYLAAAFLLGVPIGWTLTILVNRLGSGHPSSGMALAPWMTIVYFFVGAPIQEEIIFRGLLQTTLARQLPETLPFLNTSFSYAAIVVALLFGLIHLEVHPATAGAAFVLGLLAGELRHRSGSLLPAILVHTVFNIFAAIL